MRLYYSTNSPYARKCRVLVLEKGLNDKVEFANRMPLDEPIPQDLLAANPLGRVPALLLDDGTAITESALICEYLDQLGEPHLLPQDANTRFEMRRKLALIDGGLDAAVHCVLQSRLPEAQRNTEWIKRKEDSILRSLPAIVQELPDNTTVNMHSLSLAVMLEYLDFRLPHLPWRDHHPAAADWLTPMAQRDSMQQTQPVG